MKKLSSDLDFLFHEDVKRIFNNFTSLFNIRIAFFSVDGKELQVGLDLTLCDYCKAIRSIPEGLSACMEQDRKARQQAFDRRELLVYTCHGGMVEAVKPILQGERLIGFVMIGQIRGESSPPARWLMEKNDRYEQVLLSEHYRKQPLFRNSEFPKILEIFSDLMNLLTSQGKIYRKHKHPLDDFVEWIKNNPSEKVNLQKASEIVHLSSSRISHLVKEKYGVSFTQLVRLIKMEQAAFLLSHFPEKSVKDVAYSMGYSDPLYFSRHFRDILGVSPRTYRQNLLESHNRI